MEQTGNTRAAPRVPFAVYAACYAILGVVLGYGLIVRWLKPVVLEDPVQVEPAKAAQVEYRLDPNTATAAELCSLPGVGESLAQAIVAHRNERQAAASDPSAVVFRRPEDLDAVRGIGKATVERLRPHLRFAQ